MKIHFSHYLPFIVSLLLATPIHGQDDLSTDDTDGGLVSSAQGGPNLCTSDDIAKMDVSGCTCPSTFPPNPKDLVCVGKSTPCPINCSPSPPPSPVVPRSELSQCYSGCVNANSQCNGCYIWFSSLCRCIRSFQAGSQTDCIASPSIGTGPPLPNQSPSWVVLATGDLITTTQLIPGILQLGSAVDVDGGFRLGQNTLRNRSIRDTGTLAMNSVSARSEDQIHIHICDKQSIPLRGIIDNLDPNKYKTTTSVDLSNYPRPNAAMSCRVSPNKGEDVNVGRDIVTWLQQYTSQTTKDSCAQYDVGAGVITDKNGFSWACITTGPRAAESLFCTD
ncbi:hypothetical protein N7457_000346 [Penicillium paradoxum]|uniref:uncharacterized protein n=1 Tax=Penicillium paradoxum TaxID=176176 RepID=UPI002547AFA6|nr:uncharacterized protein N7457_000346 [Penicillium paradoxum]KAJ5793747.1 hypothetical protein N7457_000346 [Penicillium paradoxum]